MAIQVKTDIQLFPTLARTVADKEGIRVEWTPAGENLMRYFMSQTIFSRLFPTLEQENPTSCQKMFSMPPTI